MVECEFCGQVFDTPLERYRHIMYGNCSELKYSRVKTKGHYRWVIRDKKGRFKYSMKWSPDLKHGGQTE